MVVGNNNASGGLSYSKDFLCWTTTSISRWLPHPVWIAPYCLKTLPASKKQLVIHHLVRDSFSYFRNSISGSKKGVTAYVIENSLSTDFREKRYKLKSIRDYNKKIFSFFRLRNQVDYMKQPLIQFMLKAILPRTSLLDNRRILKSTSSIEVFNQQTLYFFIA